MDTISGNWLIPTPILPTDNLYAADNDDAPESAHVLWTKPIGDTIGGLAGGVDATGYGIGDAYEGKWGGIAIGGIFFYNKYDCRPTTTRQSSQSTYTQARIMVPGV